MASSVAGNGGDKWGAFGGGIAQPSTPEPLAQALSYGQRQTNYELDQTPPPTRDVLSEMATGRLLAGSFNGSLVEGRSTVGNPIPGTSFMGTPIIPGCTLLGSTAVPGFAMPGCSIPGRDFV